MEIKRLKISELLKIIKQGGVVVFPTDTVYGLLADATNETAVKKIFKIKKRSEEKPIPLFVKDIEMAKKFAFINKKQEDFLKMVWSTRQNFLGEARKPELVKISPKIWAGKGKVTVVLKRKQNCGLPKIVFGNKKTIGLRIPNFKLISLLLEKLNKPLTGTSANISGKPASTKIREVLRQFKIAKEKPDLILNYGDLKFSLPSLVIDLTGETTRILRN